MLVYLCGPIANVPDAGLGWRTHAARCLEAHGITTLSPLRPPRLPAPYYVLRDLADIRACDVVLANLNVLDTPGSLAEIGFAHGLAKRIFLVCADKKLSPFIRQLAGGAYAHDNLEIALRSIVDYSRG